MTVTEGVIPEAWKAPAIGRSTDHRYTFQGETFPGVTSLLKVLDKSGPLMTWAARETAEAVLALMRGPKDWTESPIMNLLESVGPEGVIKAVTARSAWKRDEAANLGTEVHFLADLIVQGKPLSPDVPEAARVRAQHYAAWWAVAGWKLRLSEALVVHPDMGYGGTFDLLAYDPEGRTVLADVKTGKGVYRESVLQLAAYGLAKYVAPMGSDTAYPMVTPDRYVILHVTTEGVREIEVSIGDAERLAWMAILDLARWSDTMKGKSL